MFRDGRHVMCKANNLESKPRATELEAQAPTAHSTLANRINNIDPSLQDWFDAGRRQCANRQCAMRDVLVPFRPSARGGTRSGRSSGAGAGRWGAVCAVYWTTSLVPSGKCTGLAIGRGWWCMREAGGVLALGCGPLSPDRQRVPNSRWDCPFFFPYSIYP